MYERDYEFVTLIKNGKKKVETRSCKTSYRIHTSSTKIHRETKEILINEFSKR